MDLKINELSEYGKEICLQSLLLINRIREDLLQKEDLSGVKKIEDEVIPVYEKIYFSLEEEQLKEMYNDDEKSLEKIEKTLDKILKDSGLKKDFILEQIQKRKDLKNKSGAEVIKKFYKYKLKEYKKKRTELLEKINRVLDREEKLNLELSNAIQEKEQMEIIDKLQPIRQEYRKIEKQIDIYQKGIEEAEKILENKWQYEIYGTREEKELKDVFLEVYDNIHIENQKKRREGDEFTGDYQDE